MQTPNALLLPSNRRIPGSHKHSNPLEFKCWCMFSERTLQMMVRLLGTRTLERHGSHSKGRFRTFSFPSTKTSCFGPCGYPWNPIVCWFLLTRGLSGLFAGTRCIDRREQEISKRKRKWVMKTIWVYGLFLYNPVGTSRLFQNFSACAPAAALRTR